MSHAPSRTSLVVATPAALAAYSASFDSGDEADVTSLGFTFVYDPSSVAVVDNVAVVNGPAGVGRWLRGVAAVTQNDRNRLAQFVKTADPATGLATDASVLSASVLARSAGIGTAAMLRVSPVGDSRCVGSSRAGWRRFLWRMLRTSGFQVSFTGSALGGDQGECDIGDWRHEGHSGEKWSDMTAAIAARAAVAGPCDVILVDLGINDVLSHNAIATIKADALAGVAALRATYPGVPIIVGTFNLCPLDAPADALRVLYNAWLLTNPSSLFPGFYAGPFADPLVWCIDLASTLTKGDLVDDRHPSDQGNAIIARGYFDAIGTLFPARRGLAAPRTNAKKPAGAKAVAVGNNVADYWAVTRTPLTAGQSLCVTGWHAPTLVDTTLRNIMNYDSTVTGFALVHGAGATAANLGVYLKNSNIFNTGALPTRWTANAYHRYCLAFGTQISATDTRPYCALWLDGALVGFLNVTAWLTSAGNNYYLGANPVNAVTASQGQHSDFAVASWTGAPYFDTLREYAERDFWDLAPMPNRGSQFSLDNVHTDYFGGSSGIFGGAAAFATQSPAKPSDG